MQNQVFLLRILRDLFVRLGPSNPYTIAHLPARQDGSCRLLLMARRPRPGVALAVETGGCLAPKANVLEQLLLLIPHVLRAHCGQGSVDGQPVTPAPSRRALGLRPPPGAQAFWLPRQFPRAASSPWFAAQGLRVCLHVCKKRPCSYLLDFRHVETQPACQGGGCFSDVHSAAGLGNRRLSCMSVTGWRLQTYIVSLRADGAHTAPQTETLPSPVCSASATRQPRGGREDRPLWGTLRRPAPRHSHGGRWICDVNAVGLTTFLSF